MIYMASYLFWFYRFEAMVHAYPGPLAMLEGHRGTGVRLAKAMPGNSSGATGFPGGMYWPGAEAQIDFWDGCADAWRDVLKHSAAGERAG